MKSDEDKIVVFTFLKTTQNDACRMVSISFVTNSLIVKNRQEEGQ